MAEDAPREQEQSIKARKRELFEAKKAPTTPRKRFSVYVTQTPPAPLTQTQKTVLFVVGGLVVLVLLAALMTIPGPRGKTRRPAAPPAEPAQSAR
jgi:hypothetical protein